MLGRCKPLVYVEIRTMCPSKSSENLQANSPAQPEDAPALWFLQGGGFSGEAARNVDWRSTCLGAPSDWPATLKTTLATMFRARQPMFLWWGPERIQFYNDGYLPSFGVGKHPRAMGQQGRDCWEEIWPIIGPQIASVMEQGAATWNEDALVPIYRNGKLEEVYWTYSYTPVFDGDGRVVGTLVICTETTARLLAERRNRALHRLVGMASAASNLEALKADALLATEEAKNDIPFALLCRTKSSGDGFYPLGWRGIEADCAERVCLALSGRLPANSSQGHFVTLPGEVLEPSSEKAFEIYAAPFSAAGDDLQRYVVFGLSGQLPFDDRYQRFLDQFAANLGLARTRILETSQRGAVEAEREGLLEQILEDRVVLERAHEERESLLLSLEQASRAKDEFLAILGHELRNPLAPIVTALRLMKDRGDIAEMREHKIIARQVNHLVRLVDDLLDVSKIARGKVDLRREIVDLTDIVSRAVETVGDLLESHRHQLFIQGDEGKLLCYGDPVRLAQVVTNLLTNAARYTPVGGKIVLRTELEGGYLTLSVEDNGIGISAEMLPRVFNLFEQAKRSSDRADGGLGIGLALAQNLVSLHGGTIHAESDGLGKGCKFVVRLPPAQASEIAEQATRRLRAASPSPHSKRILVVDDNVDAAELLQITLQNRGHEVAIAHDPLTALDIAVGFKPECAILDIGLPVIDGYELAIRLRKLSECENCRMIALTGYGQEKDKQRGREAGFEEHLVKPVAIDHLLRLVDPHPFGFASPGA